MVVTIATHNGSQAHREHNIRTEKVVSKEAHINPDGVSEIWKDVKVRDAYERLFAPAVERYNEKQTREDRKIKNYYNNVCKDAKRHPVYEMIVGVYPKDGSLDQEVQRRILKEFCDGWQTRNPNLYMCGAYYHADEEGEPHVHIDYIPVAHGYTKGMDTQNGLVKALEEQGFEKIGKLTAQIQWEKSENEHLERLCEARGLTVDHPRVENSKHVHTELYKAQKGLESIQERIIEAEKDFGRKNKIKKVEMKPTLIGDNVTMSKDDARMLQRTAAYAEQMEQELKKANKIIAERNKILADARTEADRIIAEANGINAKIQEASAQVELEKYKRFVTSKGLKREFEEFGKPDRSEIRLKGDR